ncbi:MAG TPA: response regulator [Sphingobacteriaceae bacterium]
MTNAKSTTKRDHQVILIAEDDPDDRLMIADAFKENRHGSRIRFAGSGEEVLEFLHGEPRDMPALIMLDLNMPRLDGRSLLKILKTDPETENIPVVVLTTSKAGTDRTSVHELGAAGFFTKPSSFTELVGITSSILHKWLPDNTQTKN